jgi:endonuclease/exonuclease/phosphatase (EEP) superfamily protein YafD
LKTDAQGSTQGRKLRRALRRVFVNWSQLLYQLIQVGLLVIVVASLAAYLGERLKVFEFAAQLRLQFLVGAIGCLIFTLSKREWRWSGIALLGIALNLWPIVSWYVPKSSTTHSTRRLKLVQYNVFYYNNHYRGVLDFLRAEQPDIVTMQEITSDWVAGLAPLSAEFIEHHTVPEARGSGIAVYSRIKFDQVETLVLSGDQRPNLLVKFHWEGRPVTLLTTHPQNPFGKNRFEWRNELLHNAANLLNSLPAPKILIGDLNTTMWSPYYQKLVTDTQLVNAREGYGLLPTWNARFRLPFLMIPIDHCLVSRDIEVAAIRTGPKLGSDHLPLIIELVIPATQN